MPIDDNAALLNIPNDISAALIGIPFGILTNLASDRLSSLVEKRKYLANGLDDLFVGAFNTTI